MSEQGWKLVPVEPTPEMLKAAGYSASAEGISTTGRDVYRAMLAAAPQPQPAQAVSAKPLEWDQDYAFQWTDKHHGFSIINDPDDEKPYSAAWGEDDAEQFATLEEAKAWCQQQIDGYFARHAVAQPAPASDQELEAWRKHCDTLTHQVICCGVAASHPDATLTTRGAYAGKWNSAQAEEVRKLRAERDALKAAPAFAQVLEALRSLANAADAVGVEFFDFDDLHPKVVAMQRATLAARAAIAAAEAAGGQR